MNAEQFRKFIALKSTINVVYYKCMIDNYGQRTGEVISNICTELEFDCMKMAGENVYLDGIMAQRIALS